MPNQIRLVAWSDADLDLLRRVNTPEMWKYLGGPETEEKVLQRHQRYLPANWTGSGGMFRVELIPSAEPVGYVGYWERDEHGETVYETGWHVLPEFQGRGIATAAMRALLERAAAQPGPRAMHAYPSVDNEPSNALCRTLGFTLLGATDFEFPPGHRLRCNDWLFDLNSPGAGSGSRAPEGGCA
ncbi:MAG TPA: GNAT family protein [Jatrophihabitans sp.]|jgi:RimJ/RimL family protein N-acetyltransferase|nr:GNAT family protein [Jatrophihabitans sp.]